MKFLIMGAGALGSAFGGMLADAGHDVTLIGRESHMKPIREHGLRITGIWGSHVPVLRLIIFHLPPEIPENIFNLHLLSIH